MLYVVVVAECEFELNLLEEKANEGLIWKALLLLLKTLYSKQNVLSWTKL